MALAPWAWAPDLALGLALALGLNLALGTGQFYFLLIKYSLWTTSHLSLIIDHYMLTVGEYFSRAHSK